MTATAPAISPGTASLLSSPGRAVDDGRVAFEKTGSPRTRRRAAVPMPDAPTVPEGAGVGHGG
ncbi:hypothetical protein [Umezawaea sp. Da 62-37]|uniref:hypothetical protein n=1 Tax=Umezawaea sp. Da 62-37 TaxID=3075927 RepID=UPI0028F6EF00|nr:hypothetical protein [Umezawaea sp. Da 62-37]WNV85774.1 hypothetical protein RM788_47975 [Umezawaea sp. Da 62-37]